MKRVISALPVVLGVAFLLLLAYPQREVAWNGRNDFAEFYVGSKLAGTAGLYSRAVNMATIKSFLGVALEGTMFVRPPFYAGLLKPLALFPYRTAYRLFTMVSLGSILWFVISFSKERKELPLFAALGIPLLMPLCNGQDTPLLLPLFGAAVLLFRRQRDFVGGMVLSLCTIKFHLFLYVFAVLVLKKRWRAIGGGSAGVAALGSYGLLIGGVDSYRQWVSVMRDPWISPDDWALPNIHGLVLTFYGNLRWELALAGLVALVFLWMAFKTDNFEFLLAVALVCGLLTSFHSGYSDDILLYPVFVLALGSATSALLRTMSAVLLMPIPYLIELMGRPYSSILPLLMLGWMALAALAIYKKNIVVSRRPPTTGVISLSDAVEAAR